MYNLLKHLVEEFTLKKNFSKCHNILLNMGLHQKKKQKTNKQTNKKTPKKRAGGFLSLLVFLQ